MKRTATFLLLLLLVVSCKKEKTIWESDWSAPIINDTLSLANLTNDSTLVESSGFYQLDLSRTLFDLKVSDFVGIPDTTIQEVFAAPVGFNLSPGFTFDNSTTEHVINLDDIQLKKIILNEGFIDVRVENPLATEIIFEVQLPGVSKNGVVFSNQYSSPAGTAANPGVSNQTIDLSGYTLDLTGISGGQYNILVSTINLIAGQPGTFVSEPDPMRVDATFRGVKINYARGYFGNPVISDTTNVFLEVMNSVQAGAIDIPNTSITFEIENGIKVSAEGTLTTVSNTNLSGNAIDLTGGQMGTSFNVDPATGTWDNLSPSLKLINFNSTNSNIEAYIENLGASHDFGYSLQLNPWGNVSGGYDEVFSTSKLSVRMNANMPLTIGVDGLVLRDTFDIQLNQDPEKTHIKSGELILQASNGFPISGSVKLMLCDEVGNVLHTVAGSSELRSSLYGPYSTKHGFEVEDSEIHYVLSEEVLNDINSVYTIIVESTFNSINPTTNLNEQMAIPFGAFLAVKLKTKFTSENKF
jgi:hypothetical protein